MTDKKLEELAKMSPLEIILFIAKKQKENGGRQMLKTKYIIDYALEEQRKNWERTQESTGVQFRSDRNLLRTGASYRTQGDKELILVAEFPGGEALWIEMLGDDLDNGVGFIDSFPERSPLRYGDLVRYDGGSRTCLPVYAGKVDRK